MSQNQFDALVSFVFNIGGPKFSKSTLLKLLNKGDFEGAANEFLKWCKGGGKILPSLLSRRKEENSRFLNTVT